MLIYFFAWQISTKTWTQSRLVQHNNSCLDLEKAFDNNDKICTDGLHWKSRTRGRVWTTTKDCHNINESSQKLNVTNSEWMIYSILNFNVEVKQPLTFALGLRYVVTRMVLHYMLMYCIPLNCIAFCYISLRCLLPCIIQSYYHVVPYHTYHHNYRIAFYCFLVLYLQVTYRRSFLSLWPAFHRHFAFVL